MTRIKIQAPTECSACDIAPAWELRATLPEVRYACDDHLVMVVKQAYFDMDTDISFNARRQIRLFRWFPLEGV